MNRKRVLKLVTVPAMLALLATAAMSAESSSVVKFDAGTNSSTLSGSIKGDAGVRYTINASAGQVMAVTFKPDNPSCYFNVLPPGSDQAIFIGSNSGNDFSGTLGAGGDYTVVVYLMRNAARRNETCKYSATVRITGGKAGATTSSSAVSGTATAGEAAVGDDAMRKACKAEASSMYGVKRNKVTLAHDGSVLPATDGFSIEGEVDKGAEGKKQFNCIFNKDRSLKTVTALNSDGE